MTSTHEHALHISYMPPQPASKEMVKHTLPMDILYKEAQNLWPIIFHALPLTRITKCSTLGIHHIYQLQRFEFLLLTCSDEYLCSSICVDTFLLSWFTHV